MQYKLRAESRSDAMSFIEVTSIEEWSISSHPIIPDVELNFKTALIQEDLIAALKTLSDSHVMYQTLQPAKVYTGERNYDL
ncbi:hypothetical protein AAE02nite_21580 [Adhaeribacter aerolatus]|uniref:Uncharacterized protein n=1 Tax=Adhaeribacter aerolatus TaxID=670289 RepID=A0A512AXR2_9BACT|nr:hypothetical protein [Adhaeribacter aerolatus]GEO04494.1 hypothetical protein AAE02nite_21580 [Adhaeribacter aerolatus]